MRFFTRFTAAVVGVLLILQSQAYPQQPPAPNDTVKGLPPTPQASSGPAATGRAAPGRLRILVLEGQNAVNSIVTGSTISPLVQVLDSLDRPVAGATVTFEVLPTGPGGTFGNAPIATTKTDYSGQATAVFTPNRTPGSFSIKVTASFGGETTQTRINQRNAEKVAEAMVEKPPKPWYAKWQWWAVIGAGAAGGITAWALTRDGGQSGTITISPGGVVIGGQR